MINEAPDDIAFHFCGAQTASVSQGGGMMPTKVGGAPSPLHAARPPGAIMGNWVSGAPSFTPECSSNWPKKREGGNICRM